MKFNQEKRTALFALLATTVLVAIMVVYFYNARKITVSGNLVAHTQEVLRTSDHVLMDVLNIETGSRGYLLTGNKSFLEPYDTAMKTITGDVQKLQFLTKDNPNQLVVIDSLIKQVQQKIFFTKFIIDLKKEGRLTEAEKLVVDGKGKLLSDKIRSSINLLNTEEFRLLKIRKAVNGESNTVSLSIFLLLFVFILVILGLVITLITNQKVKNKISKELEKTNELFTKLFEHNPASIYIKRLDNGKIINVNTSFINLFGFKNKEEVIGKTSRDLHLFHNANHAEEIATLLSKEKLVTDFETDIQTQNGQIKWTSASFIVLEADETTCVLSVSTDISHRKKAEEELLTINKELEAFTYSVSHDLRAPLRAINGYATILSEDFGSILNAEGKTSLNAIHQNSKRMGTLIDDLLAFSRLGKKQISPGEINMNSLVKTVLEESNFLYDKQPEIVVQPLSPIIGQQVLIKQVWINLISNAIKYSQHSSPSSIEIGNYSENNSTVYFVKDNGVGFDMQYYDKLFGVFQRLHSTQEFEGTGIGLAIIKKIINRHNGVVWAESKLNEGSTIYFSLPNITI